MCFICLETKAQNVSEGLASQSVVTIHADASFESEIGTQALLGTPLKLIGKKGGWTQVMTPDGYTGWAINTSIYSTDSTKLSEWKKSPRIIVNSYFSVLRQLPNRKSEVVTDLVMGDILRIVSKSKPWLFLQLPDGRCGYLEQKDVQAFDEWLLVKQPTSTNILKTARQFIGFPYVWGGTSVKGLDCSGFVKTCFFLNGVILPRNASQQAKTGQDVDISKGYNNLQPADLLFFGSENNGNYKITHVALYLGDGLFIHASGCVKLNSLDPEDLIYDEFNAKRLLLAKRVISYIDKDPEIVSIEKHPFYK